MNKQTENIPSLFFLLPFCSSVSWAFKDHFLAIFFLFLGKSFNLWPEHTLSFQYLGIIKRNSLICWCCTFSNRLIHFFHSFCTRRRKRSSFTAPIWKMFSPLGCLHHCSFAHFAFFLEFLLFSIEEKLRASANLSGSFACGCLCCVKVSIGS